MTGAVESIQIVGESKKESVRGKRSLQQPRPSDTENSKRLYRNRPKHEGAIRRDEGYHAIPPYRYRCRFKDACKDCFISSQPCSHRAEGRLTLLLIGHNPSTAAWESGLNYGNPTNRMWKLLTGDFNGGYQGCIPRGLAIEAQNSLPGSYGIGLTPIAPVPGNNAAAFSDEYMKRWLPDLVDRIESHTERVRVREGTASLSRTYHGPDIIAFTGKRQFTLLYEGRGDIPKDLPYGRVEPDRLPASWPFPRSQVWLLPSSSGRAGFSNEARCGPYRALAEEYQRLRNNL